mmetsp:Transcript_9679/g.15337  ORF Transcript_9679/g.15337 Transcript_9679/m.15337 type:complete len:98 (-) Transcript_9679:55-348(-)
MYNNEISGLCEHLCDRFYKGGCSVCEREKKSVCMRMHDISVLCVIISRSLHDIPQRKGHEESSSSRTHMHQSCDWCLRHTSGISLVWIRHITCVDTS